MHRSILFSECENLIRHLLVIDPSKRLSMRAIIGHKWMNMCSEKDTQASKGTIPVDELLADAEKLAHLSSEDTEPLNEAVLRHMEANKFTRSATIEVSRAA